MKPVKILFITIFLLGLAGCNQAAIGFGYIIGAKVVLYTENNNKSKVAGFLKRNTRIEILAKQIKDPVFGARRFWYKVRKGKQVGFISYDEEVMKNNLVTFRPVIGEEFGMVTASALRLRPTPSTSAPKIGLMKRNSIIQILGKGSVREKIDDKYDIWYRIKTSSGKIGYSFAGYILLGKKDKLKEMGYNNHRKMSGWFMVGSNDPQFLGSPGGSQISKDDPSPCGGQTLGDLPKQFDYVPIIARQTKNGSLYYQVQAFQEDAFECKSSFNAWVYAEDGVFVKNIYEHTKTNVAKGIPSEVIAILRNHTKDTLNAKSIKMTSLTFSKPDSQQKFYHVEALSVPGTKFRNMSGGGGWKISLLVSQEDSTYSNLGDFPYGTIRDIDGDGKIEIVMIVGERAYDVLTVYTLEPTGFEPILEVGDEGLVVSYQDPYVILEGRAKVFNKPPFLEKYAGRSKRILKLEKGEFREVGRM